jgi:hypothetical protein
LDAPAGLRVPVDGSPRCCSGGWEPALEPADPAPEPKVYALNLWESRAAFDSYRQDPALADLHPHREGGSSAYVWHLFDRLDDLRPLLLD